MGLCKTIPIEHRATKRTFSEKYLKKETVGLHVEII